METYIHMPWPTFPKVAAMPASPQNALQVCSFRPTGLAFGAQDPTLSTGPPRAAFRELDEPEIQRREASPVAPLLAQSHPHLLCLPGSLKRPRRLAWAPCPSPEI